LASTTADCFGRLPRRFGLGHFNGGLDGWGFGTGFRLFHSRLGDRLTRGFESDGFDDWFDKHRLGRGAASAISSPAPAAAGLWRLHGGTGTQLGNRA
jgi:hypothetical protein